jgi:predicted DNA-binding protein
MTKTVTLRLNEKVYNRFKALAECDNRPLSNFIETAVLRFVEELEYVDGFEMDELQNNKSLNSSTKNGLRDAKPREADLPDFRVFETDEFLVVDQNENIIYMLTIDDRKNAHK